MLEDPKCGTLTPLSPEVLLPDGTPFCTWEAIPEYHATYHVAQNHPEAEDSNEGSLERPWKTIAQAARSLNPGQRVLIHAGIYRETVRPLRGGVSPTQMIGYAAAEGESVVVTGA